MIDLQHDRLGGFARVSSSSEALAMVSKVVGVEGDSVGDTLGEALVISVEVTGGSTEASSISSLLLGLSTSSSSTTTFIDSITVSVLLLKTL
jgi:hypothetical protein